MTITTTLLEDQKRVRVAISDRSDGTFLVERSVNELQWTTIRGGVALPTLAGSAQLDDREWPDGVPVTYRISAVDPPGGLLLPGVTGDFASTPSDAALNIVGNFEVRAEITPDDATPAAVQYIASRYASVGNQRSWYFRIRTSGVLSLAWSADGITDIGRDSTVAPGFALGIEAVAAKLDPDNGAGGHTVTFLVAPSIDGPWSQLGDPVVNAGITSIFNAAAPMEVGSVNGGTSPFAGTIHQVQAWNGFQEFGGTMVANPDFGAQTSGVANFTDAAGRTWTVNGNADVEGVETASITPSLGGRIWLRSIHYPSLDTPVTVTDFSGISRAARAGVFPVKGRSLPIEVSDRRGSQEFSVELMTDTPLAELRMDAILALGGPMFLHLPVNCPVPGGYVSIGDTSDVRRTRSARSPRRYFTLPCTVVAPPGADVVGTTVTWGTIYSLYGGWEAVYAAHSAYRGPGGLLELVGDPEDLFAP